jgi:hypothetical protein
MNANVNCNRQITGFLSVAAGRLGDVASLRFKSVKTADRFQLSLIHIKTEDAGSKRGPILGTNLQGLAK